VNISQVLITLPFLAAMASMGNPSFFFGFRDFGIAAYAGSVEKADSHECNSLQLKRSDGQKAIK
jgi:hypothetical protein